MRRAWPAGIGLWVALMAGSAAAEPWTLERCVRQALSSNAKVAEADAGVKVWAARLAQVEAIFYPKLKGLAFVTAINAVEGSALEPDVRRDWSSWGPYTHLEAVLAQPLYTFGRASAGEKAARERRLVEEARAREVRAVVVVELKRLYYTHLMARSLLPTIDKVGGIVADALKQAQRQYDDQTGDVTKADLMKLEYGLTEVEKARLLARDGAALALDALKHTMGMAMNEPVTLAETRLARPSGEEPDGELAALIVESARRRPEWAQIRHGKTATEALEVAERLADAPILFLAGQLKFDWAPSRPDAKNPYHYDPYNDLSGGLALGLMFDLDPAKSSAKGDEARALGEQVAALSRFAATGIPVQVKKAFDEVHRGRKLVALSKRGVIVTRKWMAFSALAYGSGTGEAKDVLEGVVAYISAKRSYYENLRDYWVAKAELDRAVGR